jgi:hypothetical protein
MRDPNLMMRAQRAATELERSWDRWRTMHGLGTEPLPPVSSYVGYSMEEPWGQPRVVFGIAAAEAEHLAALLDRHDCAGPVYAAMMSPGARTEVDAAIRAADADRVRGRIHVPTQAQAAAADRDLDRDLDLDLDLAAEPSGTENLLDPADPLDMDEPEPRAAADAQEPPADDEDPGEGQPGLPAFRPRRKSASYADKAEELAPIPEQAGQPAEADRASAGWTRRLPGGHALPRQKRAGGSAKGASSKQEGKDRADQADIAAELAGWASGELPGQASHRRVSRPPSRPGRPPLG